MIYHTSHSEIKEINNKGLFGDVLFFSNNVYEMAEAKFIYSVDSDELSFIEPCQIDSEETLQEVKRRRKQWARRYRLLYLFITLKNI